MLRILFKSDIDQLLLIERTVQIAPWTRETFTVCFNTGCVPVGIEVEKKIIGFIILSLKPEECHVLDLCVSPNYHHQGFGRQLLEYAEDFARKKGVGIIYLEVRESNMKAIALYKKLKFHLIAERSNYYPIPNGMENALVFAKSLREVEV
jgi:[ribosomal protein S18]-alanine N-acetyltransferase